MLSKKLKQIEVEVLLNTKVGRLCDAGFVELENKERIATKTLIWTGGVAPSPILSPIPCPRNKRGQIIINEHLEVLDYPKVWAIGDCAEIINPETRQPYPPTVQHAVREGKVVAGNITASICGTAKRTFIYKPLGVLVSLGRRSAVAEILGFRFSGFFA